MCQIWKVFVKNLLEILKIEKTCIKKSNFQQFEKLENGATLSPHSPWGQSSGAESELLLSGGTKASNPLCLHSPPSLICNQKTLEFETRKKERNHFIWKGKIEQYICKNKSIIQATSLGPTQCPPCPG